MCNPFSTLLHLDPVGIQPKTGVNSVPVSQSEQHCDFEHEL